MDARIPAEQRLGDFLRDRRAGLDPEALGFTSGRRRTPGLRREEVAQRANISPTWYTCLEQGRGGAPSADALERIARALLLTDAEREHLFLLGLGRLPEIHFRPAGAISPRLQHVLDKLDPTPAVIMTAIWDVVAWNRAATVLLGDYGKLPPGERNVLRLVFLDPQIQARQFDWEGVARFMVGAFRASVARAGATAEVGSLVEELSRLSPEFARLWGGSEVQLAHGDLIKHLRHPLLGEVAFEYSVFAVDTRPDLGLVIYNPVERDTAGRIAALIG